MSILARFSKKNKNAGVEAPEAPNPSSRASKNWYTDRYQSMMIQRNILAAISLVALIGIVVCALAVQVITSKKTIEPFVIQVSAKTGIANVVDQLSVQQYVASEVISRFFISKYVKAREGFDINRYKNDYERVVKSFSPGLYTQFNRSVKAKPDGIIEKFGSNKVREVRIKTIKFIPSQTAERTAQVEFKLEDRSRDGKLQGIQHKIATISFNFENTKPAIEEHYINPLGFKVHEYIVDETVAE